MLILFNFNCKLQYISQNINNIIILNFFEVFISLCTFKEITVTGHISLDYLIFINDFCDNDESRPISSMDIYYGGGAANVSMGLSKIGIKTKIISVVGNDFYTTNYYDSMKKSGIDLSEIYSYNDKKLSKAFVVTNSSKKQRTYFYWGVGSKLNKIDVKNNDFVHISTADSCFN